MLEASGLHFSYPGTEFSLNVAHFQARPGETLAIKGPSGAGKTTFLKTLTGILPLQRGTVHLAGADLTAMPEATRRRHRLQKLGLVFQDFALLDYLSVHDNLLLPLRLGGNATPHVAARAIELLATLELDALSKKLVSNLSQGERQRVAVARALLHEPLAVFADEPTSSLDAPRKEAVMNLLLADARARNTLLILVTHDADLWSRLDRVVDFSDLSA